jgi:hypothetical protein
MNNIAERSLHTRIARSVDAIKRSFIDNLFYVTLNLGICDNVRQAMDGLGL